MSIIIIGNSSDIIIIYSIMRYMEWAYSKVYSKSRNEIVLFILQDFCELLTL